MNLKPIKLHDKEMFEHYLSGRRYRLLTYTFTNLYLWRNWDLYSWQEIDDTLCIISGYGGYNDALFPVSHSESSSLAAIEQLIELYKKSGMPFRMNEIDEDMLELIQKNFPDRFKVINQSYGANYIYRQQDLALLSGKRYDAKRNFLHRFQRLYPQHQLLELNEDLIPACINLLDKWRSAHEEKHGKDEAVEQEYTGVREGLLQLNELSWQGAVLLVDDKAVAFSLGERINDDTFGIHIEKADISYTGAFPAINNMFVKEYAQEYSYINRAEDMDNPGLRKAKLSYHPCRMDYKYRLILK